MNTIVIKGHLSRDPESRYLPNGTAVAGFGLGVNRKWKDSNGEAREEASFFEVEAWARLAELVCEHFHKGSPILIRGRLRQETWEDKTTKEKRSKVKIVMEEFDFIGGPANADRQAARPAVTPRRQSASTPTTVASPLPGEDDVPF